MNNFLNHLSMKQKLALMSLIPMIGLICFALQSVQGSWSLKSQSSSLIELTNFSVKASNLVHELQKERGMSAGYLGSGGTKFNSEIIEQRRLTDTKIGEFNSFLETMNLEQFGAEFEQKLDQIQSSLSQLSNTRSRITTQNILPAEGIGFYTNLNGDFLNLVGFLPKLSSVGEVNNSASAYVAFLQSKERAGIERAVLSNVFARDQFDPGFYDQFKSLVVTQDVYLNVFKSLATPAHLELLARTFQDSAVNETNRMRQIAIDNNVSGGFGIDSTAWFSAQTQKINLLKTLEDGLSLDLIELVGENLSAANAGLFFAIAMAVAFLGITAALGWFFALSLLRQLGVDPLRLQEVVNAIAADDLDMDLGTEGKATGIYADVQIMQQNLRDRIEADRKSMRENGRIRQALDNVDGNVMIADNKMNIIYMNDSMLPMFRAAQEAIRKAIPGFDADNLMGTSIGMFLDQPGAQNLRVAQLSDSTTLELKFCDSTFRVVFNPVFSEKGDRLGTVMEWMDRTELLLAEEEVQHVVNEALKGELSNRINLDDKQGFIHTLSCSVNQLMDISERVVADITRVMSAMSNGDLTETITGDYHGSYNRLKGDTNTSVEKLTEVVGNIQNVAGLVRSGASEISEGNSNLSQRTEEQASNLEETASSMEEMTSTVRQNAENAGQANQLAKAARQQAEKGGEVVNRAVDAMQEINTSSKKISDIIVVIDEIAFQTNLLALNASVEAARAGEQGRGFAVVASEVRNLAGRSATAAKEIKDLIEDSGHKVNEGSRLVNESGETLEEIVNGVKKVTDIVGEIAAASQEQSTGIEEVNSAVMQMDDLTQQNAALVEEAAAASESLGEQADELNQMMGFFSTDSKPGNSAIPAGVEKASPRRVKKEESRRPVVKHAVGSNIVDEEWEEF